MLDLLIKKKIFINAVCGGKGRCGLCRIKIIGKTSPPDEIEKVFIPESQLKQGYRLACRVKATKNIDFIIPEKTAVKKKAALTNLGLALDIGTTVIKGAVVNLKNGRILKTEKIFNPQQSIGGDVITRIGYALNGKYRELKDLLDAGINRLQSILNLNNPGFTTVVGNPVMLSFYLNKKVDGFAHYPFQGEIKQGIFLKKPLRYVFGCIGGFIGGDTIAGILAGELIREKYGLYIDLGTNGEIALITPKKIFAVSTAAGPAFEGAGIKCGSLAVPGAIDSVDFDTKFNYTTIKNKKPVGLCASGLIDLLAVALKNGFIEPNGRLVKNINIGNFSIEQSDIRKLQLAISAIHTGIKFLLDKSHINACSIGKTVITGEFGSHLNIPSMKSIGLIPKGLRNVVCENDLPLRGAISALLNDDSLKLAEDIRKKSQHIELATIQDFDKRFVSSMRLAPWD